MKMKQIAAAFMFGTFILQTLCLPAFALETAAATTELSDSHVTGQGEKTYAEYTESKPTAALPSKEVTISANTYLKDQSTDVTESADDRNSVVLNGQTAQGSWTVDVPEEGSYSVSIEYKALTNGKNNLELSLLVDDKLPFAEVADIQLSRLWQDDGGITQDEKGNDIRPQAEELLVWQTYTLQDNNGSYRDPFAFYFTKGAHKLTLKNLSEPVVISQIRLLPAQKEDSYEDYAKQNSGIPIYQGKAITIQAENTCYRSEPSLVAINDMSSSLTTPYDAYKIRLNSFGGNNWKYVGDRAYWKVVVPETAKYRIAVRFRQNFYNGMQTHRRLTINGEVPFYEANDIQFDYKTSWQSKTLGDYDIVLKKGENMIGMEAVLGNYSDILRVLNETILALNTIYRKIIMVTGTVPDTNRDYNLDKEIPGLMDSMKQSYEVIVDLIDQIVKTSGKRGSEVAQLTQIATQLADMIDKPYTITRSGRLDRFKSNISALGAWQTRLREQPLELDTISVLPKDGKLPAGKDTLLQSFMHRANRFLASFVVDYSVLGSSGSDKRIRVWVQSGRDQAQILKSLCDNTFSPKMGISVQFELVQGGIIEAILAGKGPDVALGRGDSDPVNFAMRNALYNLSKFPDFSELKTWFIEGAFRPYQYQGGYYGLPERQTFDMMFYRKDVFEELNITPPKTWDDLLMRVLPTIQRNNMEFGIGNLSKMADASTANIFTTLLYQMGGQLYKDDLTEAALDEYEAYQAFKMAVELYRDYKLPQEYDFLNRFRTGEMPLALAPYTMYNNLMIAAPEINGLWDMVPILGTVQEKDKINNTQVVGGTAAIMYGKTKDPQSAWQFMKWWVSSEVQEQFGNEQEAVLGPSGRYDTANKEALKNLPWKTEQLSMLESQRDASVTVAQIPGSYFTSRALNNAFVSCVIDYKIPREELLYWNDQINIELNRKRLEFGYTRSGGGED